MTEDTVVQNAIDALARQVVAEQAPAELPLFKATAARYREDPAGTLAAGSGSGSEKALGFGVETAVVLLAPFALELVKRTFTQLAEKLGDSAADSIAGKISALFGREKHDAPVSDPVEPLTPEQLALVSQTAREQAAHLDMPTAQAEALANAVIATLATHS
jgi:hypothetical protein